MQTAQQTGPIHLFEGASNGLHPGSEQSGVKASEMGHWDLFVTDVKSVENVTPPII